ncbi:MAG: hypothetical protein RSE62_08485 [Citrobacter sp.]
MDHSYADHLVDSWEDLEPIPVGVIGADSLNMASAEEPERTRST